MRIAVAADHPIMLATTGQRMPASSNRVTAVRRRSWNRHLSDSGFEGELDDPHGEFHWFRLIVPSLRNISSALSEKNKHCPPRYPSTDERSIFLYFPYIKISACLDCGETTFVLREAELSAHRNVAHQWRKQTISPYRGVLRAAGISRRLRNRCLIQLSGIDSPTEKAVIAFSRKNFGVRGPFLASRMCFHGSSCHF
jgi:hypothetical protein